MEVRRCPQCGHANAASFRFCQSCGAALTQVARTPPTSSSRDTAVPQAFSRESTGERQQSLTGIPQAQRSPTHYAQPIGQMGKGGLSVVDIWGPFAGHGSRGRHVSWLLDGNGDRAEGLRQAVTHRFSERQIPGARVDPRTLTGRGIAVERRPYYLVRRGITTVGLYIARFGHDLYISQVTYAKGAINPLRVLILAFLLIFQLYMTFGYTTTLSTSVESVIDSIVGSFDLFGSSGSSSEEIGGLGFLLCCVGPLGALNALALGLAGLHMAYKFLVDKDPLALLRTPPNEFQLDDIIALEKSVEETVRQSLDKVGIDSSRMPSAPEYGVRNRLI